MAAHTPGTREASSAAGPWGVRCTPGESSGIVLCSALSKEKQASRALCSAIAHTPRVPPSSTSVWRQPAGAPRDPSSGPAAASPSASSPAGHVCPVPSSPCSRAARTHTVVWCLTTPGPRLASKVPSPSPRCGAAAQLMAHVAEQQPAWAAGQTPAHCPTVPREPWSPGCQICKAMPKQGHATFRARLLGNCCNCLWRNSSLCHGPGAGMSSRLHMPLPSLKLQTHHQT